MLDKNIRIFELMDINDKKDESEKAERIFKELLHEEVSIWYISDSFGSEVMIKVPSVAIKHLLRVAG